MLRPHFEVATWAILAGQKGGRDLDLWCRGLESPLWAQAMSRHRLVYRRVATWFGVATWLGAGLEKRCRDPVLRSRPGVA